MSNHDEIECTRLDQDWGDAQPNMLMHPPCMCPRCAPDEPLLVEDDPSWLTLPGTAQRLRVEQAELGEVGQALLG